MSIKKISKEEIEKKENKKLGTVKKDVKIESSKTEKKDRKIESSKAEKKDRKIESSKAEKIDEKIESSKADNKKEKKDGKKDKIESSKADNKKEKKEKSISKKRKIDTKDYKKYTPETNYYIKNTLIVSNLSYKETEETIKECFEKFGTVEKVQLNYTKDNKFIGKAIVTYKHDVRIDEEVILNHKIIRIERMKNKIVNDKRIFVSRINKNMTILEIRNILKEHCVKPKDIRTRFEAETKRNNGYCHLTYSNAEEAKEFEKKWSSFKLKLGTEAFFEYAQEKVDKLKKHKIK